MNRNFKRILFSACLLAAVGGTACSDDTPEQLAEVQRVEKPRNQEVKIILMDLCRWIR